MLRRIQRKRGEYLYRKSLQPKNHAIYDKKRKIKQALQVPKSYIDDDDPSVDPKILITTSHNPSAPLAQFAKELKFVFPNAQRINRGRQVEAEIVESCRRHDFTDVIFVHETRGRPDGLVISHLPLGPTAYFTLSNVVTRHDIKDKKFIGKMSESYPHLILDNFTSKIGARTSNILKHLFPSPKPDTKRIISFVNKSDFISFRHHVYEKPGGAKSIQLREVGPRFEMKLYKITLGTMENNEVDVEWVSRPFMNTSKKRKVLEA